jgi:hypothetical protein
LIPLGLEVTVPRPIPDFVTVSVKLDSVKVGTIDLDAFNVRVHVALEAESHPLQLPNRDPVTGDAVSVNWVPVLNEAVQLSSADPHTSPAGLEVTSPRPVPALLTLSTGLKNPAVIDLAPFMVTVQVVPETASHPLHPVNVDPSRGVAVRVTTVPGAYVAEHVYPQLMPAGLDDTRPLPFPLAVRVTVRVGLPPLPTVSVVLPVRPSNVAVIVAAPVARPVARPLESIVATAELLVVHVGVIFTTVSGVRVSATVPVPSSPYVFIPQHFTLPPCSRTQLSLFPAATAPTAVVIPVTAAGMNLSVVVPSPIWPLLLYPQHRAVPFWRTAHVWMTPTETAAAVLIPLTLTGISESHPVPSPSWPE